MDLHSLSKIFGLTSIGIAPAHDMGDEYARLLDWLNHGYHGNMGWLAKSAKRRCDPAHVMAEPKSVIVCAMRYEDMPDRVSLRATKGSEAISCDQLHSRDCHAAQRAARNDNVSFPKYLLHEDYHIIMMEKLEAVAAAIKAEYPDAKCKCYVDTGPVLEKAWGARAGIGFIGKNTLFISPEHGSQMALGVVVTDMSLRATFGREAIPREQLHSRDCHAPLCGARNDNANCGSCRNCLDACPTKALISPYILDARRCISYKYFMERQQNGCDVCQDVCPFNSVKSEA